MKLILPVFSFLLIYFLQLQVYAADPESCRGVNLDQFRNAGVPIGSPPEEIYKFNVIKNQLLQSIRQQRRTAQCYTEFYQAAITENSSYWGRTLALEGCVINDDGTISSTSTLSALGITCNSAAAARRSLQNMMRIDQELRGENRAIQEASDVLEDAASADAAGSNRDVCEARRTPTASPEQLRENICCGPSAARAAGAIGALEPGITRNSCLSKIRPTNRRILSGGALGSCLANIARSAINSFIQNIGSILSLPGQLWAARSQIWSLMTSSAARTRFAQQIKQAVQQFIGDRVNAVRTCYNGYEIAQYGCRLAGQLVGNFFTGGAVGTILNLVARPATIALRGLSNIMARSRGAGRLERAGQLIRQGATATVRGARAIDRRTGGVAGGTSRAVISASRVIARPLTGTVRRASNLIAQAPPYRRLLLSAYRFERRQVQATRDFRLANGDANGPAIGGGVGAGAGAAAIASRADVEPEILPPERPIAAAEPARPALNQTIDVEQGPDGVYRVPGDSRPDTSARTDTDVPPRQDFQQTTTAGNQFPVVLRNNNNGGQVLAQQIPPARRFNTETPAPVSPNLLNANNNTRAPPVLRADNTSLADARGPRLGADNVGTAVVRGQPGTSVNAQAILPNTSANVFSGGGRIAGTGGSGASPVAGGRGVTMGGSTLLPRTTGSDFNISNRITNTTVGRTTNSSNTPPNVQNNNLASTGSTRFANENGNSNNVSDRGNINNSDSSVNRAPARENGAPVAARSSVFGQRTRLKTPDEQVNIRLNEADRDRLNNLGLSALKENDLQFAARSRYDDVKPKGQGPRVSERQQTLIEIENHIAKLDPDLRREMFDFIEKSPPNLRNNNFAAVLNSNNPAATLRRLELANKKPVILGRRAALRKIDNEIDEQTKQMQSFPDGSEDRLKFARNRSALLFERTIIDLGDRIEVRNIFSANTHNRYYDVEKKYEPHSLANTFNADIEIKKDGVRVCRGSYATEGALSSVHGGFFTFCRSQGYLDRKTNSDVLAAPTDQTLPDLERGVSVYSSFNARVGARMSLGQNGPVRYDKNGEVIDRSGGNGGSIEFFCSRFNNCVKLTDLAESVRVPNCPASNPVCRQIFDIQEAAQFSKIIDNPNPARVLQTEQQKIRTVIAQRSSDFNRLINDLAKPDADLAKIRARYPELVSAINLENEIASKIRRLRGGRNLTPRAKSELTESILDLELNATSRFDDFINVRTDRLNTADLTVEANRLAAVTKVRRSISEALDGNQDIPSRLRDQDLLIESERARLARETNPNSRQSIAQRIITLTEERSDILGAYKRLESTVNRRIRSFDFLTRNERSTLLTETQLALRQSRTPASVVTANAKAYRESFLRNGLDDSNKKTVTNLTDNERIAVAETVTTKALNQPQRIALLEAHRIDNGGFSSNNPLNSRKGIILRRGGFSDVETREIMRMGVAGAAPDLTDVSRATRLPAARTVAPRPIVNEFTKSDYASGLRAEIEIDGRTRTEFPLKYDAQIAAQTQLDIGEVVALRKNFADVIPETGETGMFKIGNEFVIDPNINLVAAYRDFTKRLSTGQRLTGEDFINVRKQAYSVRSTNEGRDLTTIPFEFKGKETARIPTEISPYVQDRLKHYGIGYQIENGKTKIYYPDLPRGPPLDQLADDVNRMLAEGQPPERITAFVTQDLLILHPFKNGNGRTARLIGQAMYRQMTGKNIIFPKQFQTEMEFSVDDLGRSLVSKTYIRTNTLDDSPDMRDLEREAWVNGGQWTRTARADEVSSEAPRLDVAFPDVIYDGRRAISYRELPENIRTNNSPLYYGRAGGDTIQSAEREALSVMSVGRGSRGGDPSYNLSNHIGSPSMATRKARGAPTGFFPTSEKFSTAKTFGSSSTNRKGRPSYAVVYVIDPRKADVLNIHNMPGKPSLNHVVFAQRLNPNRVKAAVIIDTKTQQAVRVIRNPEYFPRGESFEVQTPAKLSAAQSYVEDFYRNGLNPAAATRLNNLDRMAVASLITKKPLSFAQKKALIEAHKIDNGGFSSNNPLNSRKGIILRRAGFSDVETREIMRMGVAGQNGPVLTAKVKDYSGSFSVIEQGPGIGRESVVAAFRERFPNAKATRVTVDVPSAPRSPDSVNFLTLNKSDTESVNAWAEQVLAAAQARNPNVKLKIENVAVGFDFNARDSFIHADNAGTYIHATSTLKGGPSTIMFKEDGASKILAFQNQVSERTGGQQVFPFIQSIEPDGTMVIAIKRGSSELDTMRLDKDLYVRPEAETTAFFSGADHARVTPGQKAALHASPLREGADGDRVTFFVSIAEDKSAIDIPTANKTQLDNVNANTTSQQVVLTQVRQRLPAADTRRQLTPEQKDSGRNRLIEDYGSFQATTPQQNRAFIRMRDASTEAERDRVFVYDDNTKLGEINNTTNNKLLANAISYRRIDMVNEAMADLAAQYTKVKITHIPYSGIKVSAHGFKTNSPDVEIPEDFVSAANAKISEVNLRYYNEMKQLDLLPNNIDPMFLFRSGVSRSYRSAEQGARKARTLPDGNRPRNLEEASVLEAAERDMQFTQAAQQALSNRFNGTSLVTRDSVSGQMIFNQNGMDLIKKAKTPEVLIQQIKAKTGIDINERTARLLIKHKADTDQPIPTTLVDERQSPILDSVHGGINFDLVGAGAEGSYQSQLAFARSKNLDELYENQEIGERKVTEILNTRRARVRTITEPVMKKYAVVGRFIESGDDMSFVADNKPVPQRALEEIVQKLGQGAEPSKVRMSAVGGGIKSVETRMNIGTQGEAIEKEIRQRLIGKIPDEVLDNVIFAVKMETTEVGTGRARLMLGTGNSLTLKQRRLIDTAFEQAAQMFNYKSVSGNTKPTRSATSQEAISP